jgi:hypothetical protein
VQIFFIVDEAQNLTPHEIKTIITRAGEGTRIVFTGDIFQIDHPYLDSHSNGLSYLIEKMQGQRSALLLDACVKMWRVLYPDDHIRVKHAGASDQNPFFVAWPARSELFEGKRFANAEVLLTKF